MSHRDHFVWLFLGHREFLNHISLHSVVHYFTSKLTNTCSSNLHLISRQQKPFLRCLQTVPSVSSSGSSHCSLLWVVVFMGYVTTYKSLWSCGQFLIAVYECCISCVKAPSPNQWSVWDFCTSGLCSITAPQALFTFSARESGQLHCFSLM